MFSHNYNRLYLELMIGYMQFHLTAENAHTTSFPQIPDPILDALDLLWYSMKKQEAAGVWPEGDTMTREEWNRQSFGWTQGTLLQCINRGREILGYKPIEPTQ